MNDLQDFLNNCNKKYSKEYIPKFTKELSQNITGKEDITSFTSKYTDLNLKMMQYISLSNIADYHKWLAENFNVTPKD